MTERLLYPVAAQLREMAKAAGRDPMSLEVIVRANSWCAWSGSGSSSEAGYKGGQIRTSLEFQRERAAYPDKAGRTRVECVPVDLLFKRQRSQKCED